MPHIAPQHSLYLLTGPRRRKKGEGRKEIDRAMLIFVIAHLVMIDQVETNDSDQRAHYTCTLPQR